ncbi:MAG: hypothetical protein K9G43_09445 [Rhodobacteraceae bacterium]|nr:hypothetical protein [Paracoccaceae bacterium]
MRPATPKSSISSFFLESLTEAGFLTNPAYGDPWPAGHPAQANPVLP